WVLHFRNTNCIGAIDGTHSPIIINGEKAAPYRNRKGTLSQNVMVACDFDLNFTFISCGWEGSATDVRVLRSAWNKVVKEFHEKHPYVTMNKQQIQD
ncbi:hypothetical protein E2562_014895, partial [Oryza meyeriana var. granulata]